MKTTFLMILLQTLLLAGVLNAQQWQQRQTIPNWYAEPTLVFALGDYGYWGSMLGDLALWRYDTNNDSWQQMNNLPYPHGMMPFTINNVAYYMPVVNDQIFLYRYEEVTDSWTEVSQFPGTPRQGNFVFVVGNSAYMSCGRDFTGGHLQDNWEFNTADNTWTQRADFPGYQRTLGGAFALNGKGYAGLGWTDSNFPDPYETDFYQYDPINDLWSQKADLPISRGRVAVSGFSINNRGYILGGEMANPAEWSAELLQYNDTTDSWTQLAPFPEGGQNFINTFVVGNSAFCGKSSLWELNSVVESNSCNTLDPALQNGLVGYWPLNGNANDYSANSFNGVISGATPTEDRFGQSNGAFSFDGNSNYIVVPNILNSLTNFTVSGWYKSNENQGASFVYLGVNGDQGCDGVGIGPGDGSTWFGPGNFLVTGGCNALNWMGTEFELPPIQTWNHFALVKLPGRIQVYINGVSAHFDLQGDPLLTSNTIYFGAAAPSGDYSFNGGLDDIYFYDRGLTAEEIQRLYMSQDGVSANIAYDGPLTLSPDGTIMVAAAENFEGYQWNLNGNPISNEISNELLVSEAGAYSLTVTAAGGCSFTTPEIEVVQSPIEVQCAMPPNLPTDGLVGYWPFCGNAKDLSGNGHHAIVSGANLVPDRFGVPNSAYELNGSLDFITVPDALTEFTEVSLSGWYFSPQDQGGAFSYVGMNSANLGCNGFGTGQGQDVWFSPGNWLHSLTGCSGGWRPTEHVLPTAGSWVHFALIKNATQYQVFINGEVVQEFAGFEESFIDNFIFFGAASPRGDYSFGGYLDDMVVYNRALTPAEITSLYTGEPVVQPVCAELDPALQNGLVGYWPFCGNANDESGNGLNGVLMEFNGVGYQENPNIIASLGLDRFGNSLSALATTTYASNVEIPVSSALFENEFTISLWAKNDSAVSLYPTIVESENFNFVIQYGNTGGPVSIGSYMNGLAVTPFGGVYSPINFQEWSLITVVNENFQNKFYINGVLMDTSDDSTTLQGNAPGSFIRIGNGLQLPQEAFYGLIDDVTIHNRALTPAEITSLYTGEPVVQPVCAELDPALQNGLVGYWPFCGNANDESGNGLDGQLVYDSIPALTADRFGNENSAYSVNAAGNGVLLPAPAAGTFASSEMSYSIWYNEVVSDDFMHLFNAAGKTLLLGPNSSGISAYDGNSFYVNALSPDLSASGWKNIVVVYQVDTITIYINGNLIVSQTTGFDISISYFDEPSLAGVTLGGIYPFLGLLDDVVVWNRALTPAEITSLYTGEPVVQPVCAELDPALQNGLVGYWPFCGNANDESGNGNDGVVEGAALAEDRFGNASGAYSFNRNTANEIGIANSASLDSIRSVTISLWANLLSYGENNQAGYNHYINKSDQNNTHQFIFANNSSQLYFYYGNENQAFWTNNLPELNQWSNLVVTYNFDGTSENSFCKFYINGAVVDSMPTTQQLTPSTYDLRFGAFGTESYNRVDGTLDDIGIWNRALTAEEVALLYGNFTLPVAGCTDNTACNFLASATEDDGSCLFVGTPCDDFNILTANDTISAACGCEGILVSEGTEHTCGAPYVHNPIITYGSVNDQEGNTYKTVTIGQQVWMAENLRTSTYNNGETIPGNLSSTEWSTTTDGAWAYYGDDAQVDCPYGKLYNWYTVADSRGVCPTGWHVPTREDWTMLSNFLGGDAISGGKMKSPSTPYWYAPNEGATNESGFSALPGGIKYFDGQNLSINGIGWWWTSTEVDASWAYQRSMQHYDSNCYDASDNKHMGYSIRCIQDDENTGEIPGCTDPIASNYDTLATVNEGCEYTTTVLVFNDLNGNGIHEENEPGLGNWPVLVNNLNILLWTNANGFVYLPLPSGVQELEVLNPTDNWIITTSPTAMVDFSTGVSTASFGLQVIPGEAIVTAGPYQGFWEVLHCTDGYESGVYIENIGSQTVSGYMTLTCDPLFTPDADSYFTTPPVETGPGYAMWNVEEFMPGEFELLSFHIDGPGVDYIGQFFNFEFNLNLFDPQGNMILNQTWNVTPQVACAYDPNDITGFPEFLPTGSEGYDSPRYILPGHEVLFVVRFQNTGNYPAEDVYIDIPLDPTKWDIGEFSPLHASALDMGCLHDDGTYDLIVDSNQVVVKFVFEDIYLPDSVSNEEASHGFAAFRIKARNDLAHNTELNAQAFIYFDANPAVVTNQTLHTIFDCESFSSIVGQDVVCASDSISLEATQPFVDTFTWVLNNEVVSTASTFTYPAETGSYSVVLTTSNALCDIPDDAYEPEVHAYSVVVNPLPSAEVTTEGDVLTAVDGVAWQWSIDGIAAVTTPSIVASQTGMYTVEITNEFGCSVVSDSLAITSGITNIDLRASINAYPNPMNAQARIELPKGLFDIEIFDQTGACVRSLPGSQGVVIVERASLVTGIYHLQIRSEEGKQHIRLVVE